MNDTLNNGLKQLSNDIDQLFNEGQKHCKGNQTAGRRFRTILSDAQARIKELRQASLAVTQENRG